MASILPYMMAAGSVFGAYSQYKGGLQAQEIGLQNQALSYRTAAENAAIAEQEAQAIEKQGGAAVNMKRKEIAKLLSYQRTQEAISGFTDEGTPALVAAESAKEGAADVATIWSNALTEASLVRSRGSNIGGQLRTQGDIMAQQGTYAASAGKIGATSTLLGGVSSAYIVSKYPSLATQRFKIA
ncbi:MAG: hypothetical protein V1709_05800 [Planctomycetota bacterium]